MITQRLQRRIRKPPATVDMPMIAEDQPLASGSASRTVIACHDCDLLNRLPETEVTTTVLCARCGAMLYRYKPNSIERSLALTQTALILFILSNSFPFLAMKTGGMVQETTLLTGILDDSTALHTVLNKIRNLNMDLVSVSYTEVPENHDGPK